MALAFGLALDVYVVIAKIADSSGVGLIAAATALIVLTGLWHISPWVRRRSIAKAHTLRTEHS
jgi:hypothetical protein